MILFFHDVSHKVGAKPTIRYLIVCILFFFLKPAFKLTWDLHGKVLFLLLHQIRPTNFLVDGMFYKLVLFRRQGQEGVSLGLQWKLGVSRRSGATAVSL